MFARDVLGVGPQGFGVLRASPAVGAVLVAVLPGAPADPHRAGVKMFLAVGLFGLMTVVFAYSRSVPLSMFALAVLGGADMVSVFTRQSLVQIATPDRMRGRVSAVATLFIGRRTSWGSSRAASSPGCSGRSAPWRSAARRDGRDGGLGLAFPVVAEGGSAGLIAIPGPCLCRRFHRDGWSHPSSLR